MPRPATARLQVGTFADLEAARQAASTIGIKSAGARGSGGPVQQQVAQREEEVGRTGPGGHAGFGEQHALGVPAARA